jgi:cellulose biosynthesis protein BcsQ
MAGHVITFYSYKGGTGRTMALANAAVSLARERNASVLAIDWDLEAPGLHRFLDGKHAAEQKGVIELFTRARGLISEGSRLGEQGAETLWEAAPLDGYIGRTGVKGVSLMRAGCIDDTYAARVNGFDWEGLYRDAPTLFGAFAETLAARYDYVLIDSRTGITDAGGICTMLLPDRLVLVFTPNRQSLDGVVDLARRATDYRSRSDDLRPLVIFPLASRVELSEEELRREWRHGTSSTEEAHRAGYQPTFEQLFRELYDLPRSDLGDYFDEVQIQHAARFAFGEPIAVLEEKAGDRLSLAHSYASFTRVLADSGGPWEYRRELPRPHETDGRRHAVAELDRAIETLAIETRRARRLELRVRIAQALLLAAGFALAIVGWSYSYYYGTEYVTFSIGGAALLVTIIEVLMRTWRPLDRHRLYARTTALLARERRLYDADAGPYAGSEQPMATLTERTDEILGALDELAWGLSVRSKPRS